MAIVETEKMTPLDVVDRDYRILIGGEMVGASDGGIDDVVDPSTGEVVAHVPRGTPDDIHRAVTVAAQAQPEWNKLGVKGRGDALRELGAAIAEHAEELAIIDSVDSGNPLDAMRMDVQLSLKYYDWWPSVALTMEGRAVEASPGNLHYTKHVPYGVVGRITAFNHPGMFAMKSIVVALVAGNSMVLKPSDQTPLAALRFAEIANEILPPGVLNVVTGGVETGDALVVDPRVKRIGFTGSVATGLKIQQRAAGVAVKHVSLELGGKNALIAFPDVDPVALANEAVYGMNMEICQGQSCGSTSRVLVHESIADEFIEALRMRIGDVRVGKAYEEGTTMGPLVSAKHHRHVTGLIESGKQEGATVVTGGGIPDHTPAGGFFVEPTVFADVDPSFRIANEEIFGPVICVMPWNDLDTAIEVANSLPYGLTGSVWTHDLDLAHTTADRLDAGYVWINDTAKHFLGMPFGGTKNSGTGREDSIEELYDHMETKVIHTMLGNPASALKRLTGIT